MKYHISRDGVVRPCHATVRKCRLVHCDSYDEACMEAERMIAIDAATGGGERLIETP